MKKLEFHESKTLKLTNVLIYKLLLQDEDMNINALIEQMQTYIRTKGAMQIGPLIQHIKTDISPDGDMNIEMYFMLQCNNVINHQEKPYSFEPLIRVRNALYCRYNGKESELKYAYDKIAVEAFEREISTSGESYTIFVNSDDDGENITADVFIPRV